MEINPFLLNPFHIKGPAVYKPIVLPQTCDVKRLKT